MLTVHVKFTGEPLPWPVANNPVLVAPVPHPLVVTCGATHRDVFVTIEGDGLGNDPEPTFTDMQPGQSITIPAGRAFSVAAVDMCAEAAGDPPVRDAAPFNITISPVLN